MGTKAVFLLIGLLFLSALALGSSIGRVADHAIDAQAARPESVSDAIAASQQARQESAVFPVWFIALAFLVAAAVFARFGGEALRQWRMTIRRRGHPVPRIVPPAGNLSELPPIDRLRQLPSGREIGER